MSSAFTSYCHMQFALEQIYMQIIAIGRFGYIPNSSVETISKIYAKIRTISDLFIMQYPTNYRLWSICLEKYYHAVCH